MTKSERENFPKPANTEMTNSIDERLTRLGIDKEELEAIAVNQKIPIEVALELFECKGGIKDNSFLERIESYAG